MRSLKDRTFTHNHPLSSSFSPEDVSFAIRNDKLEFRAVSVRADHVLRRRPDAGWGDMLDDFTQHYPAIPNAVQAELQPRVLRGELTPDEAWFIHMHQVRTRIRRRIGLPCRRRLRRGRNP